MRTVNTAEMLFRCEKRWKKGRVFCAVSPCEAGVDVLCRRRDDEVVWSVCWAESVQRYVQDGIQVMHVSQRCQ